KEELDADWAVRPLTLTQYQGRSVLVLEDPGGEPLDNFVTEPMELGLFLRLGIGLSAAVSGLHGRGLIHREIKPGNVLVNPSTGEARLTGFGITTRLPHQRQSPESPEFIRVPKHTLVRETVRFALRGIGLREEPIKRHYNSRFACEVEK